MASINNKKGPLINPGLCRCCCTIKKCRVLTADYYYEERKEVYSDMFMDCFGLLLSHLEANEKDICICATCVVRLRDAFTFKQQVLQCEQMFVNSKLDNDDSSVKDEPLDDSLGDCLGDVNMVDILDDGMDFCYTKTEPEIPMPNNDEYEIKNEKENKDGKLKNKLSAEIQKLKRKLNKMLENSDSNLACNKTGPFLDASKIKVDTEKIEPPDYDDSVSVSQSQDSNSSDSLPLINCINPPAQKLAKTLPRKCKPVKKLETAKSVSQDSNSSDSLPLINCIKPSKQKLVKTLPRKKLPDKPVRKPETTKAVTKSPIVRKKPSPTSKLKKAEEVEQEKMAYANAVAILENSYVCPFLNRISIYYCYYCRDQFTNPVELREHTMAHIPKDIFELMMEYKKVPKIDITRIDCRLCPMKIDDLEILKNHLKNIHGITIYPVETDFLKFRLTMNDLACTECGAKFPYFDVLKKHMIDHFGKYVCDICGACFLEQTSLRTHLKTHNKVHQLYPCEVCGKNLKSKYSKDMHVATVHEKKATVNCYKCESSFLSHALRNRHLIEVHGDKRTFPCSFCDKVYNRRKTLMEHNRRNHLKVYRHECELCDQKFYLPSRLKEHMATHTGERKFRCDFCDKSYPRLQSLQEHLRSHNSDKRFKCVLCNAAFTQNGSLKNHMKSHHQGYELPDEFPS